MTYAFIGVLAILIYLNGFRFTFPASAHATLRRVGINVFANR
jgi:hypothetical protein